MEIGDEVVMSSGEQIHFLLELDPEAVRWRRRSMFLCSVLLHALLIVLLLVQPQLFRRSARMLGIGAEPDLSRQATFLVLPPDLVKPKRPPRASFLSDKDRQAQGRAPKVNPNGLPMPYIKGNSTLPEIAGKKSPLPPAPPAPPQSVAQASPPPAAGAKGPGQGNNPPAPPAPKQEAKLQLTDIPKPGGGGVRLPSMTPGEAIQQSLQEAARGRATGAISGGGDSVSQLNNLNSNFSTEGPIILSDTQGVDFGPYLARVVYVVRRNWYAVIPESARLGEKGRCAIVFEILRDGSVPQIRLVSSSGFDPLDRAALASIRASNPFPPLPQEFTGKHLVLQFIYLYNMGYGY